MPDDTESYTIISAFAVVESIWQSALLLGASLRSEAQPADCCGNVYCCRPLEPLVFRIAWASLNAPLIALNIFLLH